LEVEKNCKQPILDAGKGRCGAGERTEVEGLRKNVGGPGEWAFERIQDRGKRLNLETEKLKPFPCGGLGKGSRSEKIAKMRPLQDRGRPVDRDPLPEGESAGAEEVTICEPLEIQPVGGPLEPWDLSKARKILPARQKGVPGSKTIKTGS